jgi:hypothetical protein
MKTLLSHPEILAPVVFGIIIVGTAGYYLAKAFIGMIKSLIS